jgi:hypothetical protein
MHPGGLYCTHVNIIKLVSLFSGYNKNLAATFTLPHSAAAAIQFRSVSWVNMQHHGHAYDLSFVNYNHWKAHCINYHRCSP